MAFTVPTVAQFKAQFVRDFPFALPEGGNPGTNDKRVLDGDITNAQTAAGMNSNVNLWSSQTEYTYVFNLLTAHFLVTNLLASSQGLRGQGSWLTQSKSIDGVSESFAIPQRVLNSPTLAPLSKTTYGLQYLNILAPRMVGNIMAIPRQTSAR
jgi:hypothetical protein